MINKKFDNEYQTDYPIEVAYLREQNIRYSFVKVINGVTVWKYEKTEELGLALAKFWKKKSKTEQKNNSTKGVVSNEN